MWVAPGPEQGPKLAVPVSIEHSKVEPASVEWKAKLGVVSLVVPCAAESMIVSGGVSMVKVWGALWPVLPALSDCSACAV